MRIGYLLASSALSIAAAVTAAPPAQAGPPPFCIKEYDLLPVGASIRAYGYRTCDDQAPTPLPVALERRNPADGTWSRVAEGVGEAKFNCFGTGSRTYRHAQQHTLTLTANCT